MPTRLQKSALPACREHSLPWTSATGSTTTCSWNSFECIVLPWFSVSRVVSTQTGRRAEGCVLDTYPRQDACWVLVAASVTTLKRLRAMVSSGRGVERARRSSRGRRRRRARCGWERDNDHWEELVWLKSSEERSPVWEGNTMAKGGGGFIALSSVQCPESSVVNEETRTYVRTLNRIHARLARQFLS